MLFLEQLNPENYVANLSAACLEPFEGKDFVACAQHCLLFFYQCTQLVEEVPRGRVLVVGAQVGAAITTIVPFVGRAPQQLPN